MELPPRGGGVWRLSKSLPRAIVYLVSADDQCNSLAAADAEGDQSELVILALHLGQDLGRDHGAGGGDRMPEGDGSPFGLPLSGSIARSSITPSDWAATA